MSAGMDVMEQISEIQEKAFDKLFKWSQAECRALLREDYEPHHSALKNAIQVLKQKPILLQALLDDISQVR